MFEFEILVYHINIRIIIHVTVWTQLPNELTN